MVGMVGCSLLSRAVSHIRSSWYLCCPWGVCVCDIYTDIARSCDPVFGCKRAAARYGWKVGYFNGLNAGVLGLINS